MGDGHALHFVAFWVRKGTFQPLEDPIIIARLIFATIYIYVKDTSHFLEHGIMAMKDTLCTFQSLVK